jgi:hypothetical protein
VFSRDCNTSHLIQFFWDGSHWAWSDRGFLFGGSPPSACSNSPGTLDVWLRGDGGYLEDYRYDGRNWSLNNTGGTTAWLACGKTNTVNTLITSFALGVSTRNIIGFNGDGVTDFEGLTPDILPFTGMPAAAAADTAVYFYGRLPTVGMQRLAADFIANSRGLTFSHTVVSRTSDAFASDPAAICPDPRVNATRVFAVRNDGHLLMLDDTGIP